MLCPVKDICEMENSWAGSLMAERANVIRFPDSLA